MKKLMIPLTISTYCIALFLILAGALDERWPVYLWLVSIAVSFVLSIANVFNAAAFKHNEENIYRDSLIFKILLIPFFIANFILGILVAVTSIFSIFTLFFFASIPLAIIALLMMVFAYWLMLSTSSYSIVLRLKIITIGKTPVKDLIIIVLHFIFVLDVIAAIILYRDYKKGVLYYEER